MSVDSTTNFFQFLLKKKKQPGILKSGGKGQAGESRERLWGPHSVSHSGETAGVEGHRQEDQGTTGPRWFQGVDAAHTRHDLG